MNNFDHVLVGIFILLLVIVILRVYLGRRRNAKNDSEVAVNEVRTVKGRDSSAGRPARHSSEEEPVVSSDFRQTDFKESSTPDDNAAESINRDSENVTTFQEISDDPIYLIKTFSAPRQKRLDAIREAGMKKMIEAVPALIEALYEPDNEVSVAASESLGDIGDPRAIEPLLEVSRRCDAVLLKDMPDNNLDGGNGSDEATLSGSNNENAAPYNFKEMVVFQIDQLPKDYFLSDGSPIPRKDLVVKGLQDNNQQMRQMAAKAAIGLDHDDVVEPLIAALENPYEVESVRFMAAEALGGMQSEKSVDSLLKALNDENVAVRYSAAVALSGRQDEKIIEALILALKDSDRYVRSSIAYALGESKGEQAFTALFNALDDESEIVRFSIAKALSTYPVEKVFAVIEDKLPGAEKVELLSLIDILANIEDSRSVSKLRGLLKHHETDVSYKASASLMGQENEGLLEELIEVSQRLDRELLELVKQRSANDELSGLLRGNRSGGVKPGFRSLDSFSGLPQNLEKLRKSLMDESPNIRGSAANTLGDFTEENAVALLAAAAKDENEFVRSSVASSLGRIGSDTAVDLIIMMCSDESEEVRYASVKALAGKNSQSSLDCLQHLSESDPVKNVKRAARLALEGEVAG